MTQGLHNELSDIDIKRGILDTEREVLCEKIHEAAVEAKKKDALKYKTTIKNGDYGVYNGNSFVIFVSGRGKILLTDCTSIHFEINMDNRKRESLFEKKGNIFEDH